MLLEDLYQRLSYGELSNLSLSSDGNGSILEGSQPRIVLYADEALVRLYTTFILKTKSVILTPWDHITYYHLKKRFAFSQRNTSNEDFLYIQDLDDEPFVEDVVKGLLCIIERNSVTHLIEYFKHQAMMLQVPTARKGQVLTLLYQASHPKLDVCNPHSIIELPEVLHGALTAFIAHKVYSHMNTAESSAKAQEHMSTFMGICADVIDKDLVATSILRSNSRFHKRGWI